MGVSWASLATRRHVKRESREGKRKFGCGVRGDKFFAQLRFEGLYRANKKKMARQRKEIGAPFRETVLKDNPRPGRRSQTRYLDEAFCLATKNIDGGEIFCNEKIFTIRVG